MSSVETIPEPIAALQEAPRLLVQWSSPWEEFKTAIRPALSKSTKRLAGEAPTGLFPYRGFLVTIVLEALILWAAIVIPARIEAMRPYVPPAPPKYDILYYYGNELPQTQDNGGAQVGRSGNAGGNEARHPTQTIRVARGDRPSAQVVDAPKLNLPRSDSSVANLLAVKPVAGPAPAEGLRASLVAPALPNVVPPTPELEAALRRNPNAPIAPIIPPAPEVAASHTRSTPPISTPIVAPPPEVKNDKVQISLPMSASVIAPPVKDPARDLASSRTSATQVMNVVAPPVSAPARDAMSTAKLSLPTPAIVAPPPSQMSRDFNSWGRTSLGDIKPNPVPPPPNPIMGSSTSGRTKSGEYAPQVIPPPVDVSAGLQGKSGARGRVGDYPPPVVAPAPSADIGNLQGRPGGHGTTGMLASGEVVPPPPSLGGGKALTGSGRGTKGAGSGGLLDLGTVTGPAANSGGSAPGAGVVVSNQPGTKVGVPNTSTGGSIAMSPAGTAKTGLGGSGGGTGIGKGNGPGSGLTGEGMGAGKDGTGRGSDPSAKAGISPYPGPGGAGRGTNGTPSMPGVSVQGGNTITLPSFGTPADSSSTGPGHSSANDHKRSGITVVATSRSGGVLPYYGMLKGDNYSIYIDTSIGMAVMQYSDPSTASRPSGQALSEPEPIRKDLPEGLRSTHVVIACVLDTSGNLLNLRVLEPGTPETTTKILASLPKWKFRPAMRGNEAIEVTAVIGFGIDTR